MVIEILNHGAIVNQCKELAALLTRHTDGKGNGVHKTNISQLEFRRESSAFTTLYSIDEPVLGIIGSGQKRSVAG